jgi:hypothetical protein
MIIASNKIPLKFTNLPEFYEWINKNGRDFTTDLCKELRKNGSYIPSSSNANLSQIADVLMEMSHASIYFDFYYAKNPFVGHNVISHATRGDTINYNTRFHSVSKFEFKDWLSNFYHELTHCADFRSPFSFSHKSQKDTLAAPFEVARYAVALYESKYSLESIGKV